MKSTIIIALMITSMIANVFPYVSNIGLAYGVFHNKTANDTEGPIFSQSNNSSNSIDLQDVALSPARGGFTSLHNDTDHLLWIATGDWELIPDLPQNSSQPNSGAISFNATIDMVTVNNTGSHSHEMWGFKATGKNIRPEADSTVLTFNGTVNMEIEDVLYEDIPVSIEIIDSSPITLSIDTQTSKVTPKWEPGGGGTIHLWIDPVKLPDHFGNTPIYGKLRD
jgi:hypothetical protein